LAISSDVACTLRVTAGGVKFLHRIDFYLNLMELVINGCPRSFGQVRNIAQLLAELDLADKRLAVEHNGKIVTRSRFDDVSLVNGDRLEIITAVGGG